MTISDRLAVHFSQFKQIATLATGQVTIGRVTYPAARYTENMLHTPGTRAYDEGKREYTREFIYCVGMLPSAKVRGNVAFKIVGDDRDWYVAAYYGTLTGRKQEAKEPNEFHPFGNSFMLAPWNIADSKIDLHERVPHPRMAAALGDNWVARI